MCRSDISVRRKSGKEIGSGGTMGRRMGNAESTIEFLRCMGEEMDGLASEYSAMLEGFIAQLPVQQHVDLKFLSYRLDFSEFYLRQHMSMSTTAPMKHKRNPLNPLRPS
jgi:gamma-tubulin complex component 3